MDSDDKDDKLKDEEQSADTSKGTSLENDVKSDSGSSLESTDSEQENKPEDPEALKEASSAAEQVDPADALSLTPEELEDQRATQAAEDADLSALDEPEEKKLSPFRLFLKRVNIYFLLFLLVLAVAAAIAIVTYINSQKEPTRADIASQTLSEDALKQLNNTDATVGGSSQTLTIQGNAIIAGQTLARGNVNIAGNIQTGGSIQGPSITVSGSANLADTQINQLQVAGEVAIQGTSSLRDLNVAGASSFSGNMTASQITVTRLVLSGNATLEIPNHIRFSGPTPTQSTNGAALGVGGSVSLSGSDTSGGVTINSGNNPTPGCFVRITFRQRFTSTPHVILSPVGAGAGQTQYYTERDQDGFSICSANSAPSNRSFGFDYFVTY